MDDLKERWQNLALDKKDRKEEKFFWKEYLDKEQNIYEDILGKKITTLSGKISELAAKYNMSSELFFGFLEGISGALIEDEDFELDEVADDTEITITIDYEKLYKEMVEYKAEHLYSLPQWNDIFDEDKRKKLYITQKKSKTITNDKKIGRNDTCPCGSGKKYKKCCGINE